MAFCHALELLPKINYSPSIYLTVNTTLYRLFGVPLGASIEVGAVLSSFVLIFVVRMNRKSVSLTAIGAACMLAAQIGWWIWVNRANNAIRHASIQNPPALWIHWRNHWEYAHLARFTLHLCAFCLVLTSVLEETPKE